MYIIIWRCHSLPCHWSALYCVVVLRCVHFGFSHQPIIPLSASLPGVLHRGELHPGQSSHRGAGPADREAQHNQRLPFHLCDGQRRPHGCAQDLWRWGTGITCCHTHTHTLELDWILPTLRHLLSLMYVWTQVLCIAVMVTENDWDCTTSSKLYYT